MLSWIVSMALCLNLFAQVVAPQDASHPGNPTAEFEYERIEIDEKRRDSFLYLPQRAEGEKAPLVIFGHGQALNETHYNETLKHLAQKGAAALYVQYDSGFFDQDWRRMAADWNNIAQAVIDQYPERISSERVIYSGHSKGGYVGLMAAGAPNKLNVGATIVFAPAGYDRDYLASLESNNALTLVWGERDTIIDKSDVMEIFNKASTNFKQFIEVVSYPDRAADHYFPQNRSTFFGGENGISGFHYYGVWQWLVGALWDLEAGAPLTEAYIYGDKASETGQDNLSHKITR
jgi:dienelactone hydrolase